MSLLRHQQPECHAPSIRRRARPRTATGEGTVDLQPWTGEDLDPARPAHRQRSGGDALRAVRATAPSGIVVGTGSAHAPARPWLKVFVRHACLSPTVAEP